MRRRRHPWLPLAVAVLGLVGCSSPGSRDAVNEYYAGHLDRAEEMLKAQIAENDASQALFLCEYGSVLLAEGDYPEARRILLQAAAIMESFGGSAGREVTSLVGEEGHKVWKGEPYERAMNAYYLGLIAYILGDEDNALAGFKNALFMDAGSTDERYKSDFSPALYLQGRIQAKRHNFEDSERSFAEAREVVPKNPFLNDKDVGNLVVVIDVGRGPEKVEEGLQGSQLGYRDHGGRIPAVRLALDGTDGRTALVGDLFFQATTAGPREVEDVLKGKAVARQVAETGGVGLMVAGAFGAGSNNGRTLGLVGAAMFLGSHLLRSGADTRHWGCLPRDIQVFAADVEPGPHELVVDLPVAGRVRDEFTVEPGKDTVLYYRASIPYQRPAVAPPLPASDTENNTGGE